jgi:CubicO group peptidase (beta-lactamase class C family)
MGRPSASCWATQRHPRLLPSAIGEPVNRSATCVAKPHTAGLEPNLLDLVPDDRAPAGEEFGYTDTNYLLLGLVIEQIRGRPVGDVLRDGVLSIDGVERLIYQPDEVPTEPMAMPMASPPLP